MKKSNFNLARKKLARRLGNPLVFQVPSGQDVSYVSKKPGDGRGNALNSSGDEGVAGEPPKSTGYGTKDRESYPTGVSEFEDKSISVNDNIPSDHDPDDPFKSDINRSQSEYGTGIVTDFGLELHDGHTIGVGPSTDAPLGRNRTVSDMVNGTDRDRPTSYYNMHRSRPIYERIRSRQTKG